ncbi:TetR/AcrR family transcriptional regulator [Saccharopolyspora hordei]|uniref:AcrR family transcriptional regulator n=1 Tax=Saccharopolyspora hordei TaxID=1838 RepID=A0A853ARY4_9PSEU|nr:TetR/AcrR family transcriptional regulator [Saccharopolyspora hordei]NYI84337.1 AcrR family transcriptional regulator [Saccharopolyspora hordei]
MSSAAADDATLLDPDLAARNARKEQRRRQLLDAAARVMEREGSQAVSMQAVAAEAGVSVGLIYRYFGSKDELLLAVIVNVLEDFAVAVPAAIDAAGDDPVERLAAAFRGYCEVIDRHRHATVLTYRESKSLDEAGRERIKELEVETSRPLSRLLRDGIEAGVFRPVEPETVAYNLLLVAHAWALKHWYFERTYSFDDYVRAQLSLALHGLVQPKHRRRYARFLQE